MTDNENENHIVPFRLDVIHFDLHQSMKLQMGCVHVNGNTRIKQGEDRGFELPGGEGRNVG